MARSIAFVLDLRVGAVIEDSQGLWLHRPSEDGAFPYNFTKIEPVLFDALAYELRPR